MKTVPVEQLEQIADWVEEVHARLRASDMDDRIMLGSALQSLRDALAAPSAWVPVSERVPENYLAEYWFSDEDGDQVWHAPWCSRDNDGRTAFYCQPFITPPPPGGE